MQHFILLSPQLYICQKKLYICQCQSSASWEPDHKFLKMHFTCLTNINHTWLRNIYHTCFAISYLSHNLLAMEISISLALEICSSHRTGLNQKPQSTFSLLLKMVWFGVWEYFCAGLLVWNVPTVWEKFIASCWKSLIAKTEKYEHVVVEQF